LSRIAIPLDSLAVFPVIDSDPENMVWSEAFAAEIALLFTGSNDLRVVPAARAAAYAALDLPAEEIGRRLNVRCVVTCSARVSGDAVDVRAEAIDVLAEATICETSYLTAAAEAGHVQRQLARWLSSCCFGKCCLRERPSMRGDVYPRVLRALAKRDLEELRQCAAIEAMACDAFARMAVDIFELSGAPASPPVRAGETPAPHRDDVIRAAEHASDLTAARVHFRFTGDMRAAEEAFRRAESSDPAVHAHYALFLIAMRRPGEAERELRHAAELAEPFMPEWRLIELAMRVLHVHNFSGPFTPNSHRTQIDCESAH